MLDKNVMLETNSRQVLLRKISKTKKREYRRTIGYYTSIEDALEAYIESSLRSSDAVTLGQLLSEVRDLKGYTIEIIKLILEKHT